MDEVVTVARFLGFALAEWHQPGGNRTTNRGRVWMATTSDGEQVVVKWSQDSGWAEHIPAAVQASETLLSRGYPCPRTLAHGPVGELGYGVVQRRLPGVPCTDGITLRILEQVLEAIDLQANESPNTDEFEWSWIPAVVYEDHAGWWKNGRALGPEVASLCDKLEVWVNALERPALRLDYVHLDMNFSNILSLDDKLTGIVDIDHLDVGDRTVDIVGLAFQFQKLSYLSGENVPTRITERIADAARAVSGESGWRQAVAYRSISALGWSTPDGFRVPIEEAKFAVSRMMEL